MTTPRTSLVETDGRGAFVRKPSVFRDTVEKGGRFEPEGESHQAPNRCTLAFLILPALTAAAAAPLSPSPPASRAVPPLRLPGLSLGLPLRGGPQPKGPPGRHRP